MFDIASIIQVLIYFNLFIYLFWTANYLNTFSHEVQTAFVHIIGSYNPVLIVV